MKGISKHCRYFQTNSILDVLFLYVVIQGFVVVVY